MYLYFSNIKFKIIYLSVIFILSAHSLAGEVKRNKPHLNYKSDSKSNSKSKSHEDNSSQGGQKVYDTAKIIAGYKYPVEEYSVSTDDGYILEIQRIPCKNISKPNSLLLFADVWASSVYWVLSGPKYSLAFYLADLGYDVWLGNNRGGKYGQKHKILDNKDPAFWYFSIHEWGIYDLPAIIDFVIHKVNCDKLSYIGWGYGADQFFILASEKPEYMKKFKNMQALAPNVYNGKTESQIKMAFFNADEESFYKFAGRFSIVPNAKLNVIAGQGLCLKKAKKKEICDYFLPIAHQAFNIDVKGYPEITTDPPIQASIRFGNHIIQSLKNGFRHYDHGEATNLLYYGSQCPPKYNIKAADVPIALYFSDYDNFSVASDVLHLSIVIPKLIRAFHIRYKHFGYVDYPLSKVGHKVYYKRVAQVLKRYNQ